jgi:hypothetical protein
MNNENIESLVKEHLLFKLNSFILPDGQQNRKHLMMELAKGSFQMMKLVDNQSG